MTVQEGGYQRFCTLARNVSKLLDRQNYLMVHNNPTQASLNPNRIGSNIWIPFPQFPIYPIGRFINTKGLTITEIIVENKKFEGNNCAGRRLNKYKIKCYDLLLQFQY